MPRFPYTSQVSALSGRSNTPTLRNAFDAEAMGAGVGQSMGNLASGVNDASNVVAEEALRAQREEAANAVAGFDFTKTKLELQTKAPADGTGYRDTVLNSFDQEVDTYASTLQDAGAAKKFKDAMREQRLRLSSEGAEWEFKTRETYNKQQADIGLNTIQNKVSVDPTFYDIGLTQLADVVDSRPGLTQLQKRT